MSEIGLVVNANGAMPDTPELGALGLSNGLLRTIVQGSLDMLEAALKLLPSSVRVVVTLNNECREVKGDFSGWNFAVKEIARRFPARVVAVECGNEFDIFGVPPVFAAQLAKQASQWLKPAGIKVITTSVAGGNWQGYLTELAPLVRDSADCVCVHPYGQRANNYPPGFGFGELRDIVQAAYRISGKPVAITEYGIKIGDAGGETQQAEYVKRSIDLFKSIAPDVVPFACYFAWADKIGAPSERGDQAFGLLREDMSPRPAWQAFRQALGGTVPVPAPIPPSTPPATSPPIPPKPIQTYYVGSGLAEALERDGRVAIGPEQYFSEAASFVPTKDGAYFWLKYANEAKFVRWENVA